MNQRARGILTAVLIGSLATGGVGCAARGRTGRPPGTGLPANVMGPRESAKHYADPVHLSQLREQSIDILRRAAEGPDAQLRANAIEALATAPGRAEPHVASALRDANPGVRSVGAMLTGRLRLTALESEVRALQHDPSPFVRASSLYARAQVRAGVDLSPLAQILFTSPSYRVRSHVAFILGELGDPSAVEMIREAARLPIARGQEGEARLFGLQVAEALARLGVREEVEVIRAALYPSRPEELEATALAVQIIGQLGDKSAVGDLINLVEYKDPEGNRMPAEVRLAAAASLARLGQPRGTYIADEEFGNARPAIRAQVAAVYGDLGLVENLGKVRRMLEDPSGLVQVSAAAAVLRIAAGQVQAGR